jgi:hypothetical protein
MTSTPWARFPASSRPPKPSARSGWRDRIGSQASLAYNESVTAAPARHARHRRPSAAPTALLARHEALRATFSPDGSMLVGQPGAFPLPQHDLRAWIAEAQALAMALKAHTDAGRDALRPGTGPAVPRRAVPAGEARSMCSS